MKTIIDATKLQKVNNKIENVAETSYQIKPLQVQHLLTKLLVENGQDTNLNTEQ